MLKREQLIRKIVKVGNSAGVILPKEWYGGEAKVELVQRPLDIKNDILRILSSYLDSILGIYLVGSYARNEQKSDSDIDIIAISKDIDKEIISGSYCIYILSIDKIKRAIKRLPISIYPRLAEAKTILNNYLLEELTSVELGKNSFADYIQDSLRIAKINKGLIELDKMSDNKISESVIYSLILRLRGVFLINYILKKKVYSNKKFLSWLSFGIASNLEAQLAYNSYRLFKRNKLTKEAIDIAAAEKLLKFLDKELKKLKV